MNDRTGGIAAAAVQALLMTALVAGVTVVARAEPVTLTIVHVNDLEGLGDSGDSGGVARLATVVRQVRAESTGPVLVTHGGDAISPSAGLSCSDKGAHVIDIFNRLGFDALVLGNHEFDFAPSVTVDRIRQASFPILSNNAVEPDGTLLDHVTEHLVLEAGRYRVGLFGLTTPTTSQLSRPDPVTFRPVVEVADETARMLRDVKGADLVIALAHTDREEDAALMREGAVDLLLSGHDHDMKIEVGAETTFVESGAQAEFVTVVEVAMDTVEGRGFAWKPSFRVVNTASVQPDPEIQAVAAEYRADLEAGLEVEIGVASVELDTRRDMVRSRESGFANLVTDAMRRSTQADVAMINGGGIRGDRTYPAGARLAKLDIYREMPFCDTTVVLEVRGAVLLEALEHGVSAVENRAGRFAHVSGMEYRFDASQPAGSRIAGVTVGGSPLDPERTYSLAVPHFLGRGGDGYAMFADAPRTEDANAGTLVDQVVETILATGEIAPRVEGRIVRID